jgi:hypothetical protein
VVAVDHGAFLAALPLPAVRAAAAEVIQAYLLVLVLLVKVMLEVMVLGVTKKRLVVAAAQAG